MDSKKSIIPILIIDELQKISNRSMVIGRKKSKADYRYRTIGQNEKILTDGSILLVVSMTDSIGIDPSPIVPERKNF
jgi:hypothetical protein